MKIELKNLKIYQSMSEETYCFEATLYADNKKITRVTNSGRGACCDFNDYDKAEVINAWCKSNLPKWTSEYSDDKFETSLETVISDLLERHCTLKDYKKAIRKGAVRIPKNLEGTSYAIDEFPAGLTDANLNKLIEEYPDEYVLNTLPKAEAEQLWIDFCTNGI
tara:strand:+ start:2023 stop:2514 length:492 start_codon:yes stop_codon:yes gene_type:complete